LEADEDGRADVLRLTLSTQANYSARKNGCRNLGATAAFWNEPFIASNSRRA
jgi:hypothetical protein